jgi:hypothetical protein
MAEPGETGHEAMMTFDRLRRSTAREPVRILPRGIRAVYYPGV